MAKNSFVLYYNYREQLEDLSDEELGKLLRALFNYEIDNSLPKFNGGLKMAFNFIKSTLDIDKVKYENKCKKNQENINRRWGKNNTSEYERIQTNTNYTDNDNDNDNVNDNVNDLYVNNKCVGTREKNVENLNLYTNLKEQFKEFFELYKLPKFVDPAMEVLNVIVDIQLQARQFNEIKFNKKVYSYNEINSICNCLTTENLSSIVDRLVFDTNIKDRNLYIMGCIFNMAKKE